MLKVVRLEGMPLRTLSLLVEPSFPRPSLALTERLYIRVSGKDCAPMLLDFLRKQRDVVVTYQLLKKLLDELL